MKKKIALLLAAVMTMSVLPMSVFAASTNRIDKTVTVAQDAFTSSLTQTAPMLSINPRDEITSETSIRLVLENAEWAFGQADIPASTNKFVTKGTEALWKNFQTGTTWNDYINDPGRISGGVNNVLNSSIDNQQVIPWHLEKSVGDPKVAILTIAPFSSTQTKNAATKDSTYDIPLVVKCIKEGELKVTVDAGGTAISNSTHIFASGTSTKGSTVSSVSEVMINRDNITTKPIAIRETVSGTHKAGDNVTLQVNGNFEFVKGQEIWVSSDYKQTTRIPASNVSINGDTISFNLPNSTLDGGYFYGLNSSSTSLDTLYVSGATAGNGVIIAPLDEDADYGDIFIVVRGGKITKETIKVGERRDYGFTFKALENVPTILSGRVSKNWAVDSRVTDNVKNNVKTDTNVDPDTVESAELFFAETIAGTWLTSRKLSFTVPEGVKIEAFGTEDEKYLPFDGDLESSGVISKDRRTLAFSDFTKPKTASDKAEFKLTLWLSAELGFEGDVPVEVTGGGITAGTIAPVVAAKIVAPVKVESASTKINLGYQKIDTADIKITETETGTFLKDGFITIDLDSVYGSQDLGFADENLTYETTEDLKVRDFRVKNGQISMVVDRVSKSTPATLTLKNVKIGSSRSVPYGNYDILVGGNAFVTNYNDNVNLDYLPLFDDNSGYKFKDYIKVITETGTLDEIVKVSIGSTTCLINDVAHEMDVAPYIQTASASTMVPLRFVTLALGVGDIDNPDEANQIQWDPNTKTVTIFYGSGTARTAIQFTAGSTNMTINGSPVAMVSPSGKTVKAEITDARMFVPFRALGDALGVPTTWDEATRTAIYNQK